MNEMQAHGLLIPVGSKPFEVWIDKNNSLTELQDLVNGNVEVLRVLGNGVDLFSYHVNKITNAQDTRGRGLKPLPKGFDRLYSEYKNGDISARSAATKLGITHPTFLKYVKECDVRLHKDDLVQTHNPRGLTERHAAATDAARNLNHDQDAPDSPLRDR